MLKYLLTSVLLVAGCTTLRALEEGPREGTTAEQAITETADSIRKDIDDTEWYLKELLALAAVLVLGVGGGKAQERRKSTPPK